MEQAAEDKSIIKDLVTISRERYNILLEIEKKSQEAEDLKQVAQFILGYSFPNTRKTWPSDHPRGPNNRALIECAKCGQVKENHWRGILCRSCYDKARKARVKNLNKPKIGGIPLSSQELESLGITSLK